MDPAFLAFLETLPESERAEAKASFEASQRAEQRAAERAAAKAKAAARTELGDVGSLAKGGATSAVKFVSKKRRAEMAVEQAKADAEKADTAKREAEAEAKRPKQRQGSGGNNGNFNGNNGMITVNAAQLAEIRHAYVGKTEAELQAEEADKQRRKAAAKRTQFKFQWDQSEDTSRDADPLYDVMTAKVSKRVVDPLVRDQMLAMQQQQSGGNMSKQVQETLSVYDKPLDTMTVRDWRIIREDFDIRVRGGKVPNPLRRFTESTPGINEQVLYAIEHVMKYENPSPIQRQAIPIGLQRRDMIGIAETGSGKTCSFAIPMCHHILSLDQAVLDSVGDNGPLAIVMAPTRELALQIDEEIKKLLSQTSLETLAVIGGTDVEKQAYKLRKGVHIIVGTPGRMQDVLDSSYLVLNQCTYIVLDEADRMLDMGFEPQITAVLENMGGAMKDDNEEEAYKQEAKDLENILTAGQVPKHRLTAMFSATMPAEVERLARTFLRHPAIISVGDQDSGKNKRIEQRVMYINPSQKDRNLQQLLNQHNKQADKVIVFVNEKKTADKLGKTVERMGKRCVVLHGGKAQDQREENLNAFREGGFVLIATDVAGRGIDIPDVSVVINYDLPQKSIDPYCHRIGRTGRAGKSGIAYSFCTDEDTEIAPLLCNYLKQTGAFIPEQLLRKQGRQDHME
jgi:ATP-dependent RNA helicase DDX23/PRP28